MSWNDSLKDVKEDLMRVNRSLDEAVQILTREFNKMLGLLNERFYERIEGIKEDGIKRGIVSIDSVLNTLLGADPVFYILERLVSVLEPLLMVIEPFLVIFQLVGQWLDILATSILVPVFDALQPLFDILSEAHPLIGFIAGIFGKILEIGLLPLKLLLENLSGIVDFVTGIFSFFLEVLTVIANALIWVARFGILPIVLVIYYALRFFARIIDVITLTLDLIDFLDVTPIRATHFDRWVRRIFKPVIKSIESAEFLAEGGVVTHSMVAVVGDRLKQTTPENKKQSRPSEASYWKRASEKITLLAELKRKNTVMVRV